MRQPFFTSTVLVATGFVLLAALALAPAIAQAPSPVRAAKLTSRGEARSVMVKPSWNGMADRPLQPARLVSEQV